MYQGHEGFSQDGLYRTIIERSRTIIFLWRYEKDWPLEMVSDNISIFGYTSEEFVNGPMSWYTFVYGEDAERADREFNEFARTDMADTGFIQEYRIVTKDGDIRWVSDRTRAIRDDKGTITHVQGIVTDITEEKHLRDELDHYREKLEFLVDQRTAQLEKARDRMEIQKVELEQKNIALNEILKQIENKNKEMKRDILFNVNKLLLPLLKTIKRRAEYLEAGYIGLIESTLKELSTSFARDISEEGIGLTPREIEICNMIKNNMTSKEIAELLFLSTKSVEWHRYNIRRKFGLLNNRVNLTTYLKNL